MKTAVFFVFFILASGQSWAQSVDIYESAGWLESAYIKWQALDSADSYNVYYSGEGVVNKKIDMQLIRSYGSYYRADVLGLEAGTYTFKVVPVNSGEEGASAEIDSVIVEAHDRTGFAFSNGRVPGAYKDKGTVKDNAVILYITENNKNTVSLDVSGANENPCVGLQTILEGFKKGNDLRPLIVRLVGQITDLDYMNKGDIVIENDNNPSSYITFEGVGNDAVADGWGIRVKNATNIEIRNIGLMNCDSDEGDDIGLQQNNDYIWVHHCDFFYGLAGSDADQDKGDGALDCKKSGYVSLSYNHFWDTGKSNLLGNGIEEPRYLTYHHNWYDHSDSRHPRVRSHSVHVFNNYYDGIAKYGVGSTNASSVFVEANYFRNCKYPMLISMQGSDVFDESTQTNDYSDMPTFSKEDGGIIKAYNNYMTGQQRFVPHGDLAYPNSIVDFDAFVVSSRDDTLSSEVISYQGGNTYNNFDTDPSLMYSYTPESPEDAMEKVKSYAGRMHGGDFNWAFNNEVDDALYDVNAGLKNALVTYKTSLISIQGDDDPEIPIDTTEVDSSDVIHNFTLSGTASTFYDISGNISDSKGTVYYAGLTLTHCLKIESITNISFTSEKEATLILVFNEDFTGKIKVNGTDYYATSGIIALTIPAGFYEITKGDVANLYYMRIDYENIVDDISLKPYTDAAAVILYPNPVRNHLYISSSEAIEGIEIYSLAGVLVKSEGENITGIDMSKLSTGSYLLRVITADGIFNQLINKE